MNEEKIKLLFVCTVNRMRSATAHKMFESDDRFWVDSAGTDQSASTVLEIEHLDWADVILVMENHHRKHIIRHYANHGKKKIICLNIPDNYRFMQPELVSILKEKVDHMYKSGMLGNDL